MLNTNGRWRPRSLAGRAAGSRISAARSALGAAARLALLAALVCGAMATVGSERAVAQAPEWFNCPTTNLGTLSTTISRSGQWASPGPCTDIGGLPAPHFYRFRLTERSLVIVTKTATIQHGMISFNREQIKHGNGAVTEAKVLDAGEWRIAITPLGDRLTGNYTLRLRRQSAPPALRFASEPRNLQLVLGTQITPVTFPISTGGYGQLRYYTASEDNVFSHPPPGLQFDSTTRRLTGTPEGAPRVFQVEYRVHDESSERASRSFTIEYVTSPLPPTSQCEGNASRLLDGSLIREAGTLDVYVVKRAGGRQYKRLVLSWDVMNAYGWDETDVTNVCAGVLRRFTTSVLARHGTSDQVYYLRQAGEDSGQRHWLNVTAEQFDAASLDWNAVFTINTAEYGIWRDGDNYRCEDLGRVPGASSVPASLCGEECPGGMLQTEDGCELEFAWSATDQRWQIGRRVSLTLPPVENATGTVTYRLQHRFRGAPFDFSLPAGLSFDPGTRRLSGTLSPADVLGDSHRFRYTATDGTGATATLGFSADIRLPDNFAWTGDAEISDQSWTIGEEIDPLQLPSARSGAGRVTYSIRWERQGVQSEGAPPGMSFNAGTRTLSGTPQGTPGPFTIFYRATERATDVYRQIEIGAEFVLSNSSSCDDPTALTVVRANASAEYEVSRRDEITSDDCRIQYVGSRSVRARTAVQYAFTLERRSRVSFEMFASTFAPYLILTDATGTYSYYVGTAAEGGRWLHLPESKMADSDQSAVIANADASDDLGIATLGQTLPAGQYWLFATSSGTRTSGRFRLNASFEAVPIPSDTVAEQIAQRYAPILKFEKDENYYPVSINALNDNAWLEFHDSDEYYLVSELNRELESSNFKGTVQISSLADFNGRESYLDIRNRNKKGERAIYAHVMHYGPEVYGEEVILVQYWFFYLNNTTGYVPFNHEGDWEAIQLAFHGYTHSEVQEGVPPTAIGFAAHESGNIAISTTVSGESCLEQQPTVYIARNRHASYPDTIRDYDTSIDKKDQYAGTGQIWELGPDVSEGAHAYSIRMLVGELGSAMYWDGRWGESDNGPKHGDGPHGPIFKKHYWIPATHLGLSADWKYRELPCPSDDGD